MLQIMARHKRVASEGLYSSYLLTSLDANRGHCDHFLAMNRWQPTTHRDSSLPSQTPKIEPRHQRPFPANDHDLQEPAHQSIDQ